jgi:RNA polymerase sigma factor (sigma-70 family)
MTLPRTPSSGPGVPYSFRGESRFTSALCSPATLSGLSPGPQRQRTIPLRALAPSEYADRENPDERYAPEALLDRQALREELTAALTELSPEQRQILLLREVGGLRYDEIASALSLESGTVKSRIFRARQALCEILQRGGNFSARASSKKAKGGVRDEVLRAIPGRDQRLWTASCRGGERHSGRTSPHVPNAGRYTTPLQRTTEG